MVSVVARLLAGVSLLSSTNLFYDRDVKNKNVLIDRASRSLRCVGDSILRQTNNEWGSVGRSVNPYKQSIYIYILNLKQYETRNRLVDWGSAEARVPGKAHNTLVGTRHFKVRDLACVYIYTHAVIVSVFHLL